MACFRRAAPPNPPRSRAHLSGDRPADGRRSLRADARRVGDLFGPALGLPPAIAGHNSYFLWGPGVCDGSTMIIIGGRAERHARWFTSVTPTLRFDCRDCMPYEAEQTIFVARGPRVPMAEMWPRVKHFD